VSTLLSLSINGQANVGWKTIEVTRSMETLSGEFRLGLSDPWAVTEKVRQIFPGDSCKVRIGSSTILTGYVDEVNVSLDDKSHGLDVSGRDTTGDLVDCSAVHPTGQWSGLTLEAIATILCAPFGIKVRADVDTGAAFPKFAIQQGETVYEAIERMCRLRAVLAMADDQGGLLITRAKSIPSGITLKEGGLIKAIQGNFNARERFSTIYVKGQTQGDDNTPGQVSTKGLGSARDPEISRYRPLLVQAEGQATSSRCLDRARWEVAVRSGRSRKATITVQGWLNPNGQLWTVNTIVKVISATCGINANMLISELTFTVDDNGGQITQLTVVRPQAYQLLIEFELPPVKKKKGRKKNKKRKKDTEEFDL
jgi:prophage tail gpP-like protein